MDPDDSTLVISDDLHEKLCEIAATETIEDLIASSDLGLQEFDEFLRQYGLSDDAEANQIRMLLKEKELALIDVFGSEGPVEFNKAPDRGDAADNDYVVADIGLANWGRKEINITEREMPGLMAMRDQFGIGKPLSGARIAGSLHMTVQSAVLIETLKALGAEVRWTSCNIYSTQDHAAAAVAAENTPVFAIKGETLEEYWQHTHEIFNWAGGSGPNMILDNGGDATLLMHLGKEAEKDPSFLKNPDSEEAKILFTVIKMKLAENANWYSDHSKEIMGVTEENTSGVHSLYELEKAGTLAFPTINVGATMMKSPRADYLGAATNLIDNIKYASDMTLVRKTAIVCGFGETGRSSADRLRTEGMRVMVTEIDPICALQAAMEGYEVVTLDERIQDADIVVVATGNANVITINHFHTMKDKAIICNMGHVGNEVPIDALETHKWTNVKTHVDMVEIAKGKRIVLLYAGRPLNPSSTNSEPSLAISSLYTNHVLAQIELFTKGEQYGNKIYALPLHLQEMHATLHLNKLGVHLTQLSPEQESYLSIRESEQMHSPRYRYLPRNWPLSNHD